MRSSADETFTRIAAEAETEGFLAGASTDGSLVYFQSESQQPPGPASGENNLYVWNRDTGSVSLAGVLPDPACGAPPCVAPGGSFAGPYEWFFSNLKGFTQRGNHDFYIQNQHPVSEDGKQGLLHRGWRAALPARRRGGPHTQNRSRLGLAEDRRQRARWHRCKRHPPRGLHGSLHRRVNGPLHLGGEADQRRDDGPGSKRTADYRQGEHRRDRGRRTWTSCPPAPAASSGRATTFTGRTPPTGTIGRARDRRGRRSRRETSSPAPATPRT